MSAYCSMCRRLDYHADGCPEALPCWGCDRTAMPGRRYCRRCQDEIDGERGDRDRKERLEEPRREEL